MSAKFSTQDMAQQGVALLHLANASVKKCEFDYYKKYGISPQQYMIFVAINNIKGPVTPTAIAEWLDLNKNSITLIIDRMESNGLVARKRNLKDRRALSVVLTNQGKEKISQGKKVNKKFAKDIMQCLEPDELKEFNRLIGVLLEKTYNMRGLSKTSEEEKLKSTL